MHEPVLCPRCSLASAITQSPIMYTHNIHHFPPFQASSDLQMPCAPCTRLMHAPPAMWPSSQWRKRRRARPMRPAFTLHGAGFGPFRALLQPCAALMRHATMSEASPEAWPTLDSMFSP